MKLSAPVAALIANFDASAPPAIENVLVAPASASVEVTVVTAATFSATLIAAVSPPSFEVITGASFTFVTVIATSCSVVLVPFDATTRRS